MPVNYLTTARGLRYPSAANNGPNFAAGLGSLAEDVDAGIPWGGACIVPDEETRTNTGYGTLPTPDVVENVVLPEDGLLFIAAAALWKESAGDVARAALFIGANQLKVARMDAADPKKQAASMTRGGTTTNVGYRHLTTCPVGLTSQYIAADLDAADVSTGVALALMSTDTIGPDTINDTDGAQMAMSPHLAGGVCVVRAAAGTYDISVQYKATSGTVTAKSRKLWVWTQGFPGFPVVA